MRPTVRTVANKVRVNHAAMPPIDYMTVDIASGHRPGSKAFDMDVRAYETLIGLPVGTFKYWVDYREWGKHKPFKRY